MPRIAKPKPDRLLLLDQALTCLAEQGPQATSIDYLTETLKVSHRDFYEVLGPKAVAIEAVYAYAMQLLGAPDVARTNESLQTCLARWWKHTAGAALAQPRIFAFWQYYRASPHVLAADPPPAGPFAEVLAEVTRLIGRPGGLPAGALPLPLLRRGFVAQWTATVEVAAEPACQASPALRERVLTQGFAGWWQSAGLPATLGVGIAAAKARPTTASAFVSLLGHAFPPDKS